MTTHGSWASAWRRSSTRSPLPARGSTDPPGRRWRAETHPKCTDCRYTGSTVGTVEVAMSKPSSRRSASLVVRSTRSPDPLVDEAIVEINRIWNSGLRDTVVRLGQYLIQNFYGGLDAAR